MALKIVYLARLLTGIVISGLVYSILPDLNYTAMHSFFMVVGVTCFMIEGVFALAADNKKTPAEHKSSTSASGGSSSVPNKATKTREFKVQLHALFNFLGFSFVALGFVFILLSKFKFNRPHFGTWHSQFGLATCIYSLMQVIGGIVLKNFRQSVPLKPAVFKMIHALSGGTFLTLGLTTIALGTYSTFFQNVVLVKFAFAQIVALTWVGFLFCLVWYRVFVSHGATLLKLINGAT